MKIFSFVLFSAIALYTVQAQSEKQILELYDCLFQVDSQNPCQVNDQNCISESEKAIQCIETCKVINTSSFNDFKKCITSNCSSSNQDVQNHLNKAYDCLKAVSTSSMTQSFVTILLISIIFLVF
ncbi:hypothetical protein ABPG74_002701 [Tetrahymena malaccensis]